MQLDNDSQLFLKFVSDIRDMTGILAMSQNILSSDSLSYDQEFYVSKIIALCDMSIEFDRFLFCHESLKDLISICSFSLKHNTASNFLKMNQTATSIISMIMNDRKK